VAWSAVQGGLDGWTLMLVLVAAAFYASSLTAAGTVFFRLSFPDLPWPERRRLGSSGAVAAWIAILLLLVQWTLQAGFLGGGTFASAIDPALLAMVFDSAQGHRTTLALAGLLLLQGLLLDTRRWHRLGLAGSLIGAVLVLLAFVQVGHTRGDPRWLLGGLLLLHLAMAAFWLAALLPLHRLAAHVVGGPDAGRILARFGRVAAGAVGLLLTAGFVLGWLLAGGLGQLLTTGYGQVLVGKVLLVSLLLALAALNKWRLVPAFERGDADADRRLRRSIRFEIVAVTAVLVATAFLTTTTSPGTGA
jgi:copper resistance protein D